MEENKKGFSEVTIMLIRIAMIMAGIGIIIITSTDSYQNLYQHEDITTISQGLKSGTTGLGNAVFLVTKIIAHICRAFVRPFHFAYNNALFGTLLMGGFMVCYGIYFLALLKYRSNENPEDISGWQRWQPYLVMSFFVIEFVSSFFKLGYSLFKDIYQFGGAIADICKAIGAIVNVSFKVILLLLDIVATSDLAIGIALILIGLLPTIIAKFKK